VELVAREEERPGVRELDVEAEQRRRVAGQTVEVEAVEQLNVVAMQRLPVERVVDVVGDVGARRGDGDAGSDRVFVPPAASGQPSSYSRKPRSSR
jgi:hypothetical protein